MNFFKKFYCRAFQKVMRISIPLLPYREPELLNNIDDIISILQLESTENVMLVTGSKIRARGLTKLLEEELAFNGFNCVVYDKTLQNPTSDNVEDALRLYLDNNCDGIIAFGGGSVMDCAKALGSRVVCPKKSLDKMQGLLKVRRKLPVLFAIPTTAGSGSEATVASVIVDSKTNYKYIINDFCLIPKYAVMLPTVTESLPPYITAITGMDALTHAIEVFIGKAKTKKSRKAALEAIGLIINNLENAYNDGSNYEARENMLNASYLAGCAFTKSYVGYIHALSHPLSGKYGVEHGLANAILLPHVLRAYDKSVYKELSYLSKLFGIVKDDCDMKTATEEFINYIEGMNQRMGIPNKLDCIRKEDIPMMAKHADKEANPLYPVPFLWNAKELEKIYLTICVD